MGTYFLLHIITLFMLNETSCVRPHPPVLRALKHAQKKLQGIGIKVVNWEPYKHGHGWDIIV
jgi:hypothetical protein